MRCFVAVIHFKGKESSSYLPAISITDSGELKGAVKIKLKILQGLTRDNPHLFGVDYQYGISGLTVNCNLSWIEYDGKQKASCYEVAPNHSYTSLMVPEIN
ncbi:MAG: hypothetical protein ABUT20_12750 [Bacteroidota bacterium]